MASLYDKTTPVPESCLDWYGAEAYARKAMDEMAAEKVRKPGEEPIDAFWLEWGTVALALALHVGAKAKLSLGESLGLVTQAKEGPIEVVWLAIPLYAKAQEVGLEEPAQKALGGLVEQGSKNYKVYWTAAGLAWRAMNDLMRREEKAAASKGAAIETQAGPAETPRRVVLYANQPEKPVRAAVFTWSKERGVELEILDPDWGRVAEGLFRNGVPLDSERRSVSKDEGPAFMRALIEPRSLTYYSYIDESKTGEKGQGSLGRDEALDIVRGILRRESHEDAAYELQAEPLEEGFWVSEKQLSQAGGTGFGVNGGRWFVSSDRQVCGIPTFVRSASHFQDMIREPGGRERFAWWEAMDPASSPVTREEAIGLAEAWLKSEGVRKDGQRLVLLTDLIVESEHGYAIPWQVEALIKKDMEAAYLDTTPLIISKHDRSVHRGKPMASLIWQLRDILAPGTALPLEPAYTLRVPLRVQVGKATLVAAGVYSDEGVATGHLLIDDPDLGDWMVVVREGDKVFASGRVWMVDQIKVEDSKKGERKPFGITDSAIVIREDKEGVGAGMKMAGMWRSLKEDKPVLDRALGKTKDETLKTKLLAYLKDGDVILRAPTDLEDHLDPSRRHGPTLAYMTDGEWVWGAEVPYYLEHHGVMPATLFLASMHRRGFKMPEVNKEQKLAAMKLLQLDEAEEAAVDKGEEEDREDLFDFADLAKWPHAVTNEKLGIMVAAREVREGYFYILVSKAKGVAPALGRLEGAALGARQPSTALETVIAQAAMAQQQKIRASGIEVAEALSKAEQWLANQKSNAEAGVVAKLVLELPGGFLFGCAPRPAMEDQFQNGGRFSLMVDRALGSVTFYPVDTGPLTIKELGIQIWQPTVARPSLMWRMEPVVTPERSQEKTVEAKGQGVHNGGVSTDKANLEAIAAKVRKQLAAPSPGNLPALAITLNEAFWLIEAAKKGVHQGGIRDAAVELAERDDKLRLANLSMAVIKQLKGGVVGSEPASVITLNDALFAVEKAEKAQGLSQQ